MLVLLQFEESECNPTLNYLNLSDYETSVDFLNAKFLSFLASSYLEKL